MAGERRQLKVGEVVVYVDSFKQEHLALTTSVFGTGARYSVWLQPGVRQRR
jgi:hypothetical protein